jgi:hypothetical protein
MVKRKPMTLDPLTTLDQAAAAVEANDRWQAHKLLRAYRRWRLAGNAAPPGADEKYGQLVNRSGPKFTAVLDKSGGSAAGPPAIPQAALASLARLLLSMEDCLRKKYEGVEVNPVVVLREAEAALERGDLESAGKDLEAYDGFCVCGGNEPPGGKDQHDRLRRRLSALSKEP